MAFHSWTDCGDYNPLFIMENEDLGIVTKTKNEIFWEKVKGESEKEVERLREGIIFHEAVSKLAEEKIALEKS